MKSELAALITTALEKLVVDGALSETPDSAPQIDRPRDPSHGDLSCNIAMVLAKRAGMAPRELATSSSLLYRTTTSLNAAISPVRVS